MQAQTVMEPDRRQPRDGEALESLVRAEKVKALYGKGVFALGANLVNSVILVAALWSFLPHPRMLVWLGLAAALSGIRLVGWSRHRRRRTASPYDPGRWLREWIAGSLVSGILWGAAGVAFGPAQASGASYLVLLVIGGMVAGVSASTSSSLAAFLAFTVPALALPLAGLGLAGGPAHLPVAALLVVFAAGMTTVSWRGNQAVDESIRLRFKNALLVEDVVAARDDLAQLNRQLEERIALRTGELRQAVAERERFVSIVSHELRAPLGAMLLNLDLTSRLLRRSSAVDRAQLVRYCEILQRQAKRMLRLVDDLLDLSRLSTGRMHYEKVPVDLKGLLDRTLEEMAPQLEQEGHERFAVEVEEGLRGNWDPGRIQQVLVNLLTNALRHGAAPYSCTARRVGEEAEVVVRDSGRGIPLEDQERIFEAFASAHPGGSPGLGLGLHIAAQIVRAHQGSIRAESVPDHGAAFIVRLPLCGASLACSPAPPAASPTPGAPEA